MKHFSPLLNIPKSIQWRWKSIEPNWLFFVPRDIASIDIMSNEFLHIGNIKTASVEQCKCGSVPILEILAMTKSPRTTNMNEQHFHHTILRHHRFPNDTSWNLRVLMCRSHWRVLNIQLPWGIKSTKRCLTHLECFFCRVFRFDLL